MTDIRPAVLAVEVQRIPLLQQVSERLCYLRVARQRFHLCLDHQSYNDSFGPRTDATCRELRALLTSFNIGMLTTDEWDSYGRELPKEKRLTGKIFTQRIERNNLTLRTRIKRLARRTIGFFRSVELHEKVIGAFIEKYMFY